MLTGPCRLMQIRRADAPDRFIQSVRELQFTNAQVLKNTLPALGPPYQDQPLNRRTAPPKPHSQRPSASGRQRARRSIESCPP